MHVPGETFPFSAAANGVGGLGLLSMQVAAGERVLPFRELERSNLVRDAKTEKCQRAAQSKKDTNRAANKENRRRMTGLPSPRFADRRAGYQLRASLGATVGRSLHIFIVIAI